MEDSPSYKHVFTLISSGGFEPELEVDTLAVIEWKPEKALIAEAASQNGISQTDLPQGAKEHFQFMRAVKGIKRRHKYANSIGPVLVVNAPSKLSRNELAALVRSQPDRKAFIDEARLSHSGRKNSSSLTLADL